MARYQTHTRDNYKEPTDGTFDDCTSENLAAEDSSDSEGDAVEENGCRKSNKKLIIMKLRHVRKTVINQQLEFHYFIDII